MSRSFTRIAATLVAVLLLSGAAPQRKITFTPQQIEALDKVSAYLNSVRTLRSGFIQLAPNGGLDQGQFLMSKPGKLRFFYNPPNPTSVVATGGKIYVQNTRMKTLDRFDLSDTPLGLLLNDNIDLKTSTAVTGVDVRDDALLVQARTGTSRQGTIVLTFSYPQIELRQWAVKDNQGATTMVALQNAQTGMPLEDSLFTAPVRPKNW